MKWAIGLLLALLATPSFAATGWSSYLNDRFGYETAIPPGFVGQGEPDDHDGQVFRGPAGQKLTVFGGYIVDSSFDADVQTLIGSTTSDGWTITYQATTPGWASYSGTKGQRVIYVREISGCKADRTATFQFEYPATQINALKPVVERLVAGLKQKWCD